MRKDEDLREDAREPQLRAHTRTRLRRSFALTAIDAPRTLAQVEYEKCAERIEAKGHGNCAGQYMDYIACADNCAKEAVFKALK